MTEEYEIFCKTCDKSGNSGNCVKCVEYNNYKKREKKSYVNTKASETEFNEKTGKWQERRLTETMEEEYIDESPE